MCCRLWPAPILHRLISKAFPHPQKAAWLFVADLLSPALAHLLDHCVRQKPLLPGAALVEMATAAIRMLYGKPQALTVAKRNHGHHLS